MAYQALSARLTPKLPSGKGLQHKINVKNDINSLCGTYGMDAVREALAVYCTKNDLKVHDTVVWQFFGVANDMYIYHPLP